MRKNVLLLASMALAVLLVSEVALAQPVPSEVLDASHPTNSGPPNLTESGFKNQGKCIKAVKNQTA
jgi:hypothetical protein